MARNSQEVTQLVPLDALEGGEAAFGAGLASYAALSRAGGPVLRGAAWPGVTFHRCVDKLQRSEHELGSLTKNAHRPGHRARCHAAQHAILTRPLNPRLDDELSAFLESLDTDRASHISVWTSLVTPVSTRLLHRFREIVAPETSQLRMSLLRAFSSAYEPEFVSRMASAGLRSCQVAIALGTLPERANTGTLWFGVPQDHAPAEHTESVRKVQGLVRYLGDDTRPTGGQVAWIGCASSGNSAPPLALTKKLDEPIRELNEQLPRGAWEADFVVSDRLRIASLIPHDTVHLPSRSWVAVGEERREVPHEASLALLEDLAERVLRGLLDELGERPNRRTALLEPVEGRVYLNLQGVDLALGKSYPSEGRFLASVFGGQNPMQGSSFGDQRFVLPKLLASLTLVETKLRTTVREFESEAQQHKHWLDELDLAILPDDALRTTLRETVGFFKHTSKLYLRSKWSLVRILSAACNLASLEDQERAPQLVFATLQTLGDVSSAEIGLDALALSRLMSRDQNVLEAVERGARTLAELPGGIATAELKAFLQRHGHWALVGSDLGSPRLIENAGDLLGLLRAMSRGSTEAQLSRASQPPTAASAVERMVQAASWLEKRAISALVARAASFVRIHEKLRVWLSHCGNMLRKVLLDAGRRLERLNPELVSGSVWDLAIEEISGALYTGNADLLELVSLRRARRAEQLATLPPPERLADVISPPPGLPCPGPRFTGAFTGTGSFAGRVVRLGSLRDAGASLGPKDVLVTSSAGAISCLLAGHSGAVICEAGNALSHLAVVARELGVPAVLGLGPSASLLADGDRVFVDGDRGIVERYS